jgi:hypothetical protein
MTPLLTSTRRNILQGSEGFPFLPWGDQLNVVWAPGMMVMASTIIAYGSRNGADVSGAI